MESGQSWAKEVIALYREGAGDAEVAAELKVTIKEYYKQLSENSAFSQLVDFGRTLSQAWWEKQARLHVKNKQFNSPLYSFYMKNKYGWADKTENINVNDNSNQDLDALTADLMKQVAEFTARYTPELTDAQRVIQGLNVKQV